VRRIRIFTCVSYAEARNRYRLDVRPSVRPSVRLSVCLSVTRSYCIKTAERIDMISSPHDSTFILVLCIPRSSRNSDGVTPCGGAKYRWGIKFARFSTNKSLYLAIYHPLTGDRFPLPINMGRVVRRPVSTSRVDGPC